MNTTIPEEFKAKIKGMDTPEIEEAIKHLSRCIKEENLAAKQYGIRAKQHGIEQLIGYQSKKMEKFYRKYRDEYVKELKTRKASIENK